MVFVAGHVWNSTRMMLLMGPKGYFGWNWHAVIGNCLFLLTFLFCLASHFDGINNDQAEVLASSRSFVNSERFYQYYNGMVQIDDNEIKMCCDFSTTLKTFFWAILCMSPLGNAAVVIENLPGETSKTTIINQHTFTEAVGYICVAFFKIIIVVKNLSMLIATISSTFQRVYPVLVEMWMLCG
ncbi:hypothetical protein GWI33_011560 [Rhynchophorus ferrugineus]|uniref:Uncharacterized protein n=1 Tax=Rhynchophorus ferrugineus TaxID=354439 RepID=A0A834MN78_RHYFE|nr:hypothetical protein GWI33_011560 [Rhynchophorus ferrugineus]